MEKLNIAEILKDCPKGMELDCTMFEDVKFIGVEEYDKPICIRTGDIYRYLTKFGTWTFDKNAKCVIFPKGKTTWEGFQRPFKDGDVIACDCPDGNSQLFIFKEYDDSNDTVCYLFLDTDGTLDIEEFAWKTDRLATEEEKQKLFDAIKANGYKWNAETKTLEKLIEPKFKVGDKIKHRLTGDVYKVLFVLSNGCGGGVYDVAVTNEIGKSIDIKEQDSYELVPNKFDITTLKPLESRVLIRDKANEPWYGQFFSHIEESSERPYVCVGPVGLSEYRYCIPYEGNRHLLCTTDDCDDYYKNWK